MIDLRTAWQAILQRARLNRHHEIRREALSVREHMTIVLRSLRDRRFAEFEDLFEAGQGVALAVVTFLAILELTRESLVEVTQAEPFAPIYVRLAFSPA